MFVDPEFPPLGLGESARFAVEDAVCFLERSCPPPPDGDFFGVDGAELFVDPEFPPLGLGESARFAAEDAVCFLDRSCPPPPDELGFGDEGSDLLWLFSFALTLLSAALGELGAD